ncbi:hypothetical protein GOP47_0020114 [Adiantum capillus-veneris]|uniref:RING-type E3 ubiquitin transferase n=1 Tax=Adiantum capillus-veneris TaxID=13818 RepID=A0A9D4UCC7_ADICA|nr:hypothetical protein GOP47_0020114 [Adiantum capillus-veneris]
MRPHFRPHVEIHRRAAWELGAFVPAVSPMSLASPMLLSRSTPSREKHVDRVASPLRPPLENALTIRNHVNILKTTLRMEADEENPGSYVVSFSFDADMAGSLRLCFLARVDIGTGCRILPWLPDVHEPMQVSFVKGHGQKFKQALGMGIYLDAFDTKLVEEGGPGSVYPLVILARTSSSSEHANERNTLEQRQNHNVQVTQAAMRKKGNGHCDVHVLHQILLVDNVQYELHDLYGAKEASCIVCMSETRQIALMPCRHMCICNLCATALTTAKTLLCPLCRQSVQAMLRVNIGS